MSAEPIKVVGVGQRWRVERCGCVMTGVAPEKGGVKCDPVPCPDGSSHLWIPQSMASAGTVTFVGYAPGYGPQPPETAPTDAAGRLETVSDWLAKGVVTPGEAARLLEPMPDPPPLATARAASMADQAKKQYGPEFAQDAAYAYQQTVREIEALKRALVEQAQRSTQPVTMKVDRATVNRLYGGEGHTRTALDVIQARKPPEPWRPSVDEWDLLPDVEVRR